MAFIAGNSKITTTDDAGLLESMTSAFDFLGVTRVELKLAHTAVKLDELHADNAAASIKDEALY